jgi:hypothetical protein
MQLQEAQLVSEPQMILPLGTFYTRAYGKLEITAEFAGQIVDNWRRKVMGTRQPFIDTDHNWGKANGWIQDLQVREDGLYAAIDWTPQGRDNVENGYYKYFSADIGGCLDIETGDEVYPVLIAAALTNVPVMNIMPPVKLSESESGQDPEGATGQTDGDAPAHGDGGEGGPAEDNPMTYDDLVKGLSGLTLTTEQKGALVKALGLEPAAPAPDPAAATALAELRGQVTILGETNTRLTADLKTLQGQKLAERKAAAIKGAIDGFRILPKDKEAWEKKFDEAPDLVERILSELPKAIDDVKRGHGSAGTSEAEPELDADDEAAIALGEKKDPKYREKYLAARKAGAL